MDDTPYFIFSLGIAAALTPVVSVLLGIAVKRQMRDATVRLRRRTVLAAVLFPATCLVWIVAIFLCQVVVNTRLLERETAKDGSWNSSVTNGYQVMLEVPRQGVLFNRKHHKFLDGVRTLQIADPYILGSVDLSAPDNLYYKNLDEWRTDSFFVLDARSGKITFLRSYDALRDAASLLGIRASLEPIRLVYSRYQPWVNDILGFLYVIPPMIGFFLLIYCTLRKQTHSSFAPI